MLKQALSIYFYTYKVDDTVKHRHAHTPASTKKNPVTITFNIPLHSLCVCSNRKQKIFH